VGFVFQGSNMVPFLTARENLLLVGAFGGADRSALRARADDLLEELELTEVRDQIATSLSGGERQRVAIARALATHPVLVLADEPTANLDTENGRQVMEIMQRLNEETGTTFIFATHDPRVIPFARRVVELRDGRVTENSRHT